MKRNHLNKDNSEKGKLKKDDVEKETSDKGQF